MAPKAGFGSSTTRFAGHLGVGASDPKNYSPGGDSYFRTNFSGSVGKHMPHENRDNKNKTSSFTFGVSRDNMRKMHVDQILLTTDGYTNVPGSGTYESRSKFGGQSHNETTCFSLRKKLYEEDLKLDKDKKLPGPGYYAHQDIVSASIANSKVANESKFSVP